MEDLQHISLKKIILGRNSRLEVTHEELDGLMSSIKEEGLLQPIGVTPRGNKFEVIYGNRRFMACKKLGLKKIPCVIREFKDETDFDIANITENIQRRNLSPAEIGKFFKELKVEGKMTMAEIAVRTGVTKAYVKGTINVFDQVPEEIQNKVESLRPGDKRTPGKISARAVNRVLTSARNLQLNKEQRKRLILAITEAETKVPEEQYDVYAAAIKSGRKNLADVVPKWHPIGLKVMLPDDEFERLNRKHITRGPFKSMGGVMRAILSGKIADQVKLEGSSLY